MYCWSCGKDVKENLNYCSNCGARVERGKQEDYSSWMNNPATSVGYLGIFGLGGFIFLVLSLLKRNVDPGAVFTISALYLVALFGICFMILRFGSNNSEKPSNKNPAEMPDYAAPKKFRSGITNQLEAPSSEPIPSVTENTTRTLDEVLIERK